MKTKILIAIICTIFNLKFAQAEQLKLQSHANCTKSEYNPREFTSQDLFFSSEPYKSANCIEDKDRKIELDQQAWALLKKEYPDTYIQVVPFDLVGDKQEEFIVQGSSPSGGTNFYFLKKKNGKWKLILAITGGFTISGEEITNWSRSGIDETWQTVYSYSKGSYKETSRQAVPLTLLHQKGFIELMMKLNERGVKWN
jgi:hypothetical protein